MTKVSIVDFIAKKLKRCIAIVEDGDTASQAIAAGKYVIWKGNPCKASSAISQGDTLSSSNLTALSDGVGNEISASIPAVVDNLTSDSTTSALSAAQGKVLNSKIKYPSIGDTNASSHSRIDELGERTFSTWINTNYLSYAGKWAIGIQTVLNASGGASHSELQVLIIGQEKPNVVSRSYNNNAWSSWTDINSKLIHDTFPVTCSYSANTKTETEITSTIAKTGYTPIIVVGYVISSLLLANIEESSGRYYILLREFGGTSGTTTVNVHVLYQKS